MSSTYYNDTDLVPGEISERNRSRFDFFKTSYNMDFTKKKINKRYGYGKVNAFVGGDMLNPKLSFKRDAINANYIKKNQEILSKSTTGITTYQHDYCGFQQTPNFIRRLNEPPY